jgi:hypothetical protein
VTEFVAGIQASDDGRIEQGEEPRKTRRRRRTYTGVKPLQEFHADPAYAGDLHRADMAWTVTPPAAIGGRN